MFVCSGDKMYFKPEKLFLHLLDLLEPPILLEKVHITPAYFFLIVPSIVKHFRFFPVCVCLQRS